MRWRRDSSTPSGRGRGRPRASKQAAIERSLLKRACTPADIAAAIVFLCADTSMITAQTLVVDGGYSL